jgi:hypothetical protein
MIKQKIVIQYYVPEMYFDKFVLVAWISRIRRPYPDQGNSKPWLMKMVKEIKAQEHILSSFFIIVVFLLNLIII